MKKNIKSTGPNIHLDMSPSRTAYRNRQVEYCHSWNLIRAFNIFNFIQTLFWKSTDTKLNRIWAIKDVKPEDYAAGEMLSILVRYFVVICHSHSSRCYIYVLRDRDISGWILGLILNFRYLTNKERLNRGGPIVWYPTPCSCISHQQYGFYAYY